MRTAEHSARELGSRAARAKLAIQARPYFTHVRDGLSLGYRRGKRGGSWIARAFDKENGYRYEPLGKSNDLVESVGMSYQQALDAVQAWVANVKRTDSGEPETDAEYTVARAMADYIADRERTKRKSQPRAQMIVDAHINPMFGHIQLDKLSHGKVKAWRDGLATAAPRQRTGFVMEKVLVDKLVRGEKKQVWAQRATTTPLPQAFREVDMSDPDVLRMRQATANRILTVLKAALNYAHQERKVASKSAWESVKPYRKVDVPKVRFLTDEEVSALMPACEPSFQVLVKAALLTGCRYGELTAMKVEAFDEAEARVYVADSKNGESRYVDLNNEGVALFAEMTEGRNGKETIFLRANGKHWKSSEQKRPMDAACAVAKLECVTFHILRHTYASHAVMNGMPIAVLSEHLGHKDTRITERHYAHLSQSYKKKLIRDNAPSFGFASAKPGPMLVSRAS